MNLYIRFFDDEAICHNMSEVQEYLDSIPEIEVTSKMLNEIQAYVNSDTNWTKRYKVTSRNYFIMIKTELGTLAEFHANGKEKRPAEEGKSVGGSPLDEVRPGWYRCEKRYRRMIPTDAEGRKMEYVDTSVEMLVRAETPRQCHERIVEYLQQHPEVDPRSQFGGPKESNFTYEYKGELAN